MSSAPKDSDGPMAGARTAQLGLVWEAANSLAAAGMPKQFSGSIKRSDIPFTSANSNDYSSLIPLHNRRLVDPAIAPTSPSHRRTRSRLVATCLVAMILIGGTGAMIALQQFPIANIWWDSILSSTQRYWPTPTLESQRTIPRLRVESSRGISGEPIPLGLTIDGPPKGAVVNITGVLAGMDISTGTEVGAHRWELLPEDVPYAFVAPSEKFVGFVDLVAELRLADGKIVDLQRIYLEWGPPPPGFAKNQYNREEPTGPNSRAASVSDQEKTATPTDSDEEKTATISSSSAPTADPVEHQAALAFPSKSAPTDSDEEKTATISSSSAPTADLVEHQGALAFPSKSASSDSDQEKTAVIQSSITSTPRPQELTASFSSPIARDTDINKSAIVPNSPSLAQDHVGREETMVPLSFKVDRDQPVTEAGLPAFAQRQLGTEDIAVLLKRGKDLIAHGDIAAARVALKRAAEADDAEAALALASTYDPFVLRDLKVYGFPAEPAKAHDWYKKAKELGSIVAPRRLEILAREAR